MKKQYVDQIWIEELNSQQEDEYLKQVAKGFGLQKKDHINIVSNVDLHLCKKKPNVKGLSTKGTDHSQGFRKRNQSNYSYFGISNFRSFSSD